jgi:hypothetical protein
MKNGNGNGNGQHPHRVHGEAADLERIYRDLRLEFRHFPDCKVAFMRWQALRRAADCVIREEDGYGTFIIRNQLIAFADSSYHLHEKLAVLTSSPSMLARRVRT